jgi:hypothetical protein
MSYDYNQLCSHLRYLVIEFLIAKLDIIPSSVGNLNKPQVTPK